MPPQPEISPKVIFDGLKDAEIFREKSLLKKQSDPVWSTICDSLNIKMKPKSLYLYVYNDRNNCKTNLLKYKGLKPIKKKKKKSAQTEEFIVHKDCIPKNCKPLHFQIKLNEEEWS
ncbi:hypothetical protein TSAR_010555 [Trichomalopsis sarcophagae]|uniref:MADF domain-containing protein n=1 Tax=Trichomalopsis sarcophagae TaxID=543379 RepID=A0A232EKU5_9HYME|nr:hypothetical protein TSAR_010555 [Trichomalopsis sarcophagae]